MEFVRLNSRQQHIPSGHKDYITATLAEPQNELYREERASTQHTHL